MCKTCLTCLMALALLAPVYAQGRDISVRDTRSTHATYDRQRPLTSSFLDTPSTRLVDARRGFRPFDSVFRDSRLDRRRAFQSRRGILRPDRWVTPLRDSTPRRAVAVFHGGQARGDVSSLSRPAAIVILDEREDAPRRRAEAQDEPIRVRIYTADEPDLPAHRGAVIVRQDGTVISIGD